MEKTAWFEREEDWVIKRPIIFSKRLTRTTFMEVDRLMRLLDNPPPGTEVLDLCCGIGRHSLEFARRGFKVTGVDITRPFLDIAGDAAQKQGLAIELIQADMRNYCPPDSFDLIASLCTSFGYFDNIEDDLLVLRNMHRMLKKNGRLAMEILGKEVIAATFQKVDELDCEGYKVVAHSRILDDWNRLECVRKITKDDQVSDDIVSYYRLYSATEMRAHMVNAGFSSISIFGDFGGAPYNNEAKSMVVVATK